MTSGFKQTPVGLIPKDWDVKCLDAVCTKIQDGTHFSPTLGGSDYLYVTSKNIGFGTFDVTTAQRIDTAQHAAIYRRCDVRKGDILLTKDGASTGNATINHLDEEFSLLSSVAFLRFHPREHDARYYLQQILSSSGQRRIKELMAGNAITRLTLSKIRNMMFPVPTLSEQTAIGEVLSDTDALLGNLDQLIAKKFEVMQAAKQRLLMGKQRLPGFGGEWETLRFGEIAIPRRDRADPRRAGTHEFCVELEHIVPGSGRLLGNTTTSAQSSQKSVFRAGDVLFGKLRAYLRKYWLANRDGVCSTEIWAFAANRQLVLPSFLFQLVTTDRFIEVASTAYGTHMPRSDWNVVSNFEVHLPKLDEQAAIADILSDMDAEIEALEQKLDKTRLLKQGMMQELLTGRTRLI